MRTLLLFICCFATMVSVAQMQIPENPKERVKTYKEFLISCKQSMDKAAALPNTPENQNKRHADYSIALSNAQYLNKLEPDSAEPYKLEALCACYNNNSKACYDNINKYFAITHTIDTALLKDRAFAYVNRCMYRPEPQYYDLAKRDLDTLINTYHMERLIIVRSYLNRLFVPINIGSGWYQIHPADTIYQYREKQDNDLYISKFGQDTYYHTVLSSH